MIGGINDGFFFVFWLLLLNDLVQKFKHLFHWLSSLGLELCRNLALCLAFGLTHGRHWTSLSGNNLFLIINSTGYRLNNGFFTLFWYFKLLISFILLRRSLNLKTLYKMIEHFNSDLLFFRFWKARWTFFWSRGCLRTKNSNFKSLNHFRVCFRLFDFTEVKCLVELVMTVEDNVSDILLCEGTIELSDTSRNWIYV
jgi:hypothetical protein